MKSGNVLLGVLAGVAAGALLGILMAPDKGKKTRKQISDLGDGVIDSLSSKLDDFIAIAKSKLENETKSVEKIASKVKTISEEARKETLNATA